MAACHRSAGRLSADLSPPLGRKRSDVSRFPPRKASCFVDMRGIIPSFPLPSSCDLSPLAYNLRQNEGVEALAAVLSRQDAQDFQDGTGFECSFVHPGDPVKFPASLEFRDWGRLPASVFQVKIQDGLFYLRPFCALSIRSQNVLFVILENSCII